MLINNNHSAELQAQEQTIRARVELYEGSTLIKICDCGETLEEFTIEKTGEGKYFGYGICQKLRASIIDIHNTIDIQIVDSCEASFGVNSEFIYPYPKFYIQEVERDEVFNVISFVAYDALFKAANHTVSELSILYPFTLKNFAEAICAVLGLPLLIDEAAASAFNLSYTSAANFSGTETLRAALDALAEATQTIYYIDRNWNLFFKRLNKDGAAALSIGKDDYITLSDEGAHSITGVSHVTELGDNVEARSGEGDTQFIRNNPFWDLRDDVGTLVDNALAAVNGLSINQFECDWRGNYLLEIGDKITAQKDDNTIISTFILDDNITFDGTFWQKNSWAYDGNEAETPSNPTSLGEVLNQTSAKVDKANREISLVTSEVSGLNTRVASITIDLDGISTKVSSTEETANNLADRVAETETAIANIDLTPYNAALEFTKKVEENGVTKLDTTTGFTFDENGLKIEKSGTEIFTTISEDGMVITKSNEEVLTADNTGVHATNLKATTYLIIGETSRLESWEDGNGKKRTACFWIGR
jgi:uncharacterized protein YoxC